MTIQLLAEDPDTTSAHSKLTSFLLGLFTAPVLCILVPLAATPTYRFLRWLKSSEQQRNAALCIKHPLLKAASPASTLTAVLIPLRAEEIVTDTVCAICREWPEIPVSTPCSHTFCNGCIRRALSASDLCPMCRHDVFNMEMLLEYAKELHEWRARIRWILALCSGIMVETALSYGAFCAVFPNTDTLSGPFSSLLGNSAGATPRCLVNVSTAMCDPSVVDYGMKVWLAAAALEVVLLVNDFVSLAPSGKRNISLAASLVLYTYVVMWLLSADFMVLMLGGLAFGIVAVLPVVVFVGRNEYLMTAP